MKIKKCLIFILIFIIAGAEVPKASPVSTTYKQGIYYMNEVDVDVVSTAKLLTPNNTTSLIIIDSKSNEKFYKRFDTIDEVINLGFIKAGDTVIIVGSGEIEITHP
jgi:hypothetical protein